MSWEPGGGPRRGQGGHRLHLALEFKATVDSGGRWWEVPPPSLRAALLRAGGGFLQVNWGQALRPWAPQSSSLGPAPWSLSAVAEGRSEVPRCVGWLQGLAQVPPGFLGLSGEEATCQAGDAGLIPGSGRSPWRRTWPPLQCSCLGNPRGQRSLAGYSPWGRRVGRD